MFNYTEDGRDLIVKNICDFDLEQTLECGQTFHFEKIDDEDYIVIAKGRMLHVSQAGKKEDVSLIFHDVTKDEFENIWATYFDLYTDYGQIKERLLSKDDKLKEAIESKWGVRILNQDFFEMLMSFIISQNKQISQIKQLVFRISQCYGSKVGEYNGKVYCSFPDINQAAIITEDDFREMKMGFRAPYLYDAVHKCQNGQIDESEFLNMTDEQVMQKLMTIKGVGTKVASCVMLFGLGRKAAFPVDVWMKRIMEKLYFGKDTKKEKIMEFAKMQYGDLGGFAQQYLFYYARSISEK